jgi:hypothetical protein
LNNQKESKMQFIQYPLSALHKPATFASMCDAVKHSEHNAVITDGGELLAFLMADFPAEIVDQMPESELLELEAEGYPFGIVRFSEECLTREFFLSQQFPSTCVLPEQPFFWLIPAKCQGQIEFPVLGAKDAN